MADAALAPLIEVGEELLSTKLLTTAAHCMWIYDYLLTFGDEIEYAWNGRRSWVFALFIANRYSPVPEIIWSNALNYGYTSSHTKWLGFAQASLFVVLAEITVALRMYAMTEKNKWVGGALFSMIAAQFAFGIYSTVSVAASPLQHLPDINLDPFKVCAYEVSKLDELIFVNMGVAFDVLTFSIIFFKARGPRYSGIPSILDTILRDATLYFVLIFSSRILLDVFILFAPESFSIAPGIVTTMFVPLMTSRLMLSLKKASIGTTKVWSFSAMAGASQGISATSSLRFSRQVPGGLYDAPGTPALPNFVEEGTELESISQPSPRQFHQASERLSVGL